MFLDLLIIIAESELYQCNITISTSSSSKMQIVKSVRISLTMDDIIEYLPQLSKEQIIEKFRLLLDRKQLQINQKIQKNNAEHLLVLQKKMLILERKDDQIVKLNNLLSTYKNQLHEYNMKNNDLTDQIMEYRLKAQHFQKKFNQYDSIFKEEKGKREKLKKQYQKLQLQHKILTEEHISEVRNHKKIKDDKQNWQQQTQLLINNHIKKHEIDLANKINLLTLDHENKVSLLLQQLDVIKNQQTILKQKYAQGKANIANLNKAIEILNKQLMNEKIKQKKSSKLTADAEIQTDHTLIQQAYLKGNLFRKQFLAEHINRSFGLFNKSSNKQSEKPNTNQIQTQTILLIQQCEQCKIIKSAMEVLENELKQLKPKQPTKNNQKRYNTMSSQTNPAPVILKQECQIQTIFRPLQKRQELDLEDAFQDIKRTTEGVISNWKRKYQEMQLLFLNRPSKLQDRQKIGQLERTLVQYELKFMDQSKLTQNLRLLNNELHQKIHQLQSTMNHFKVSQMELSSVSVHRPVQIRQHGEQNSVLNSTFRKSRMNQNISLTISVRQPSLSRSKNRSFSPSIHLVRQLTQNPRNLSQSKKTDSQLNLRISRQAGKNLQQFKGNLLERGIVFREKAKLHQNSDQISEFRKYKKYKGSLKKVPI